MLFTSFTHYFDIICLSETFLDSSTTSDDDDDDDGDDNDDDDDDEALDISECNLTCSDNPLKKNGGACIYYKNVLSLRVFSVQFLQEYIDLELNVGGKTSNFVSLYRSPSQTQDKFKKFIEVLESLCQNKWITIVLTGYLNDKSRNWYCHDKCSH